VQKFLSSSLLSKNIKIKIYRTIVLLLFCMGVKLGTSHSGRGHRLTVFENGVLRKIFGLNGDEVTGVWRRLHNDEPYELYASPYFFRTIKREK
jgi:hypothetical protein